MKKYTFYFICFLMAVAVTSCKKEKEEDSFLKGQMTDFHGQKAYIDGSNYSCFRQGETIFVNGRNNCTVSALSNSDRTCTISGAEEANGYYAFYPANMISATDISSGFSNATVTLPRVQQYAEENGHQVIDNPMAGQLTSPSGTIQFYNLCALLKVTVQSNWAQLDSIQMILKGTTLWGTGTVNASDWKLEMTNGQANHDTISLDFTGTNHAGNYTGEAFYIMVPEVVIADDPNLAEVQIRIFGKRAANTLATPRSYSISLSDARIVTHNNIQLFNKVYADTVRGVGVFTVSSTGKKVSFSPGNLVHVKGSGEWHFPTKPYHGIPAANYNYFFGFGTSGWNSGANKYQPGDYNGTYTDYYVGGSPNNDLTGNYAEADWGWHNTIRGNDGYNYPPHTWRVLTIAEWKYLLTERNATKRFAKATVNGVKGIIIYPDNYSHNEHSNYYNDVTKDYSVNTLDTTQWNTCHKWGCVFLPAHGYRAAGKDPDGSNNNPNGTNFGFYASSTHGRYDNQQTNIPKEQLMLAMKFTNNSMPFEGHMRHEGACVRLVHDLN